jgi:hypothetical protein
MPVSLTCSCGVFLEVDDRFAGQTITCPDCQKPLKAPPIEPPTLRTSGLALASVICTLVGAFTVVVPFLGALLGLVSLRQIARHRDRLAGRRLALLGIVLGLALGGAGVYCYRAGLIDPDKLINRLPLAGTVDTSEPLEVIRSREGFAITRPSDKWGVWHQKSSDDKLQGPGPIEEDLVLLNPGQDAYISCLVTRNENVSLQQCKDKALDVFREPNFSGSSDQLRSPPRLTERSAKPLPKQDRMQSLELILEKTQVGQNRVYLVRVIKVDGDPNVFLLVASARKSRFARLEGELRKALDSFRPLDRGID